MFSEPSVPAARRRRPPLLAVLLAAQLAWVGCGKKGDPMPPLRVVPQTTQDLKVRQLGRLMLLDMAYPATTTSGMPLGGIDSVELLEYVKPTLEGGELPPAEVAEVSQSAETLLVLSGSDLGAATLGDRIQIRVPVADPLPEPPIAHFFVVKTTKGAEVSALSNVARLVPVEAPEPPSDLQLEARHDGVLLTWKPAGDEPKGFEVYRREARIKGYGNPLQRLPADRLEFLDRSAQFGKRYIYTVRTLTQEQPPILSAEAGEKEIDYEDRFPPPLPKRFVALGERGQVRLRWDASPAGDLAGYHLYRRDPGREPLRITDEPFTGTEYLNRGLASGLTYSFRIQAIDQLGNASEQSSPVEATVR